MSKVLIYGEIKAGKIKKTAFELAGEGRKLADALGGELAAVVIGPDAEQFAPDLGRFGVDTVFVVEGPALEAYNSESYAQALAHVIKEKKPFSLVSMTFFSSLSLNRVVPTNWMFRMYTFSPSSIS